MSHSLFSCNCSSCWFFCLSSLITTSVLPWSAVVSTSPMYRGWCSSDFFSMGETCSNGRTCPLLPLGTRAQIATLVVSFLSPTPRTLFQIHFIPSFRARFDSLLSLAILVLAALQLNLHVVEVRVISHIRTTWPILVRVSLRSTSRAPCAHVSKGSLIYW